MRNKIIGIFICILFIVGVIIPSMGASLLQKNETQDSASAHPEYYNVTTWRFYGSHYEKQIKQVSYEEAMKIKEEFEQIDKSNAEVKEKLTDKNTVLQNHNIITKQDTLENFQKIGNKIQKTVPNRIKSSLLIKLLQKKSNNMYDGGGGGVGVMGGIELSFYGPVAGLNIGLPVPVPGYDYSEFASILLAGIGHGPSTGLCTSVFFIPSGIISTNNPMDTIFFSCAFCAGICTFLPFIKNMHNEGMFFILAVYIFCFILDIPPFP